MNVGLVMTLEQLTFEQILIVQVPTTFTGDEIESSNWLDVVAFECVTVGPT